MKNKLTKEDKYALAITAVIFLLGIVMVMSCSKIDQPELDGRPLKRPVSVVVVK